MSTKAVPSCLCASSVFNENRFPRVLLPCPPPPPPPPSPLQPPNSCCMSVDVWPSPFCLIALSLRRTRVASWGFSALKFQLIRLQASRSVGYLSSSVSLGHFQDTLVARAGGSGGGGGGGVGACHRIQSSCPVCVCTLNDKKSIRAKKH